MEDLLNCNDREAFHKLIFFEVAMLSILVFINVNVKLN